MTRTTFSFDGWGINGPDVLVLPSGLPTEDEAKDYIDEDGLRDVLADLMHLCELTGLPFDELVDLARKNYERERDGHEQG